MYGGLCALATYDRSQLHKQVLVSNTFKLFLELEPQLRDVIINFYESKYGKCLKQLEEMKDNMMLDIYLASHVNALFSMIRSRSLVQYFRYIIISCQILIQYICIFFNNLLYYISPYSSADLRLMASSFNTSVAALEDELMTLILDGKIQARIDSHNKVIDPLRKSIFRINRSYTAFFFQVLFAQDTDQRSVTFEKAIEMAHLYEERARIMILRSAILKSKVS